MDTKTHLLSFLVMDIYTSTIAIGSPPQVVQNRVEEALNFVDLVEAAMKRRGWLEVQGKVGRPKKIKATELVALSPAGSYRIEPIPEVLYDPR